MRVVVLQGLPGSGKSTWADAQEGAVVCSADHHFVGVDGVYRFNPSQLAEAHGNCLRKFIALVQQGEASVVVVDNTNTTVVEVAPYMAVASAFQVEAQILRFDADPKVCAERNTHGVPPAAIETMAKRLANFPHQSPPWWTVSKA